MSQQPFRRRSPPLAIWLVLGIAAAIVSASAALASWVWQQNEQILALQAELGFLQREQQVIQSQLRTLQNSAGLLEERLANLEADSQAHQSTGSQVWDLQASVAETQAQVADQSSGSQALDLQASLTEAQAQLADHQAILDDLTARVKAITPREGEATDTLPLEVRLSVESQKQSHSLSCESSAASMAAQYHGVPLSEADVLAELPRNDNPHLGFRGNVDGPTGGTKDYGVYAGPIQDILNSKGLQARPIAGGLDGIKAAIARGNPVIAWVTYDCQPRTPVTELISGQEVTLVPYQHVVVVTGYNNEGVRANDPLDGQEDFYRIADFERALDYFGDMAIEVGMP
jgi:uncharacterized protein YvpB